MIFEMIMKNTQNSRKRADQQNLNHDIAPAMTREEVKASQVTRRARYVMQKLSVSSFVSVHRMMLAIAADMVLRVGNAP